MAMPAATFGPALYTGGGQRRPTFYSLRTLRWPGTLSCNNLRSYPFLSVISTTKPSSTSSRGWAKAEATIHGDGRVGQQKGPFAAEASMSMEEEEGPLRALQRLTPVVAIKWTAMAALALTAGRAVYSIFFNPAIWTYCSWLLVVWPLPAAIALGFWSFFAVLPTQFNKRKTKTTKEREQVFILAGALTWLILVPLGLRHGYVEGWPLTLFFIYMYFFLISAIIRLRRYGELSPKSVDKQWSSSPSRLAQIGFVIAVVGGHWFAAFQGPHLYYAWNWQWPSRFAAAIITLALALHYNATYFLGKYFDRLVKPTALVVFGPYRFVRHPIYASYMLLFAGYCIALRAYWSMAFLILACLLYYEQRVRLEETLLEEAFGEQQYKAYREKVKYKYFPFLY